MSVSPYTSYFNNFDFDLLYSRAGGIGAAAALLFGQFYTEVSIKQQYQCFTLTVFTNC